jgi:hypothetical protein
LTPFLSSKIGGGMCHKPGGFLDAVVSQGLSKRCRRIQPTGRQGSGMKFANNRSSPRAANLKVFFRFGLGGWSRKLGIDSFR